MNTKLITLLIAILSISILTNFIIGNKLLIHQKEQRELDQEFIIELARIAGNLKENNMDSYTIALEHAHKVSSLSKYTSYSKKNNYVNSYTKNIVTDLRNAIQFNKEIVNLEEVSTIIIKLSENPTDQQKASELLILIQNQKERDR